MATDLLQLFWYALVYGAVTALGAIGVSLVYGILRFANFAQGDLMTTGAYIAFAFVTGLGWSVWEALVPAAILTGVIAVILDRLFYKRLRSSPVILLIASFGAGLILRALVQIFFGPDNHAYESGISIPFRVAGVVVTPDSVLVLVAAIIMVVLVHLFLAHTRMGKSMRAMSDNVDLALVSGIPAERVIMLTWIIGGGVLAAVGGVLLGLNTQLRPPMGFQLLLPIFAAAIVGGIGRPYGAILGALIISLAMQYSTLFLSPAYEPAVAFAIMLIVLIVRPEGLFKGVM